MAAKLGFCALGEYTGRATGVRETSQERRGPLSRRHEALMRAGIQPCACGGAVAMNPEHNFLESGFSSERRGPPRERPAEWQQGL